MNTDQIETLLSANVEKMFLAFWYDISCLKYFEVNNFVDEKEGSIQICMYCHLMSLNMKKV